MPFFCVSGPILGALAGPGGRSCFFQGPFFASSARSRRAPAERTFGSLSGGRGFFFLLSGVECLRVERAGGRSSARAFDFFPAARREPGPAVGRTAEGFFWEGFPLFSVPARRRLGGRAAGAFFVVRLFFSVFASLTEAPPLQAPEGGGVQLRQGAFFPLRFSFFFRSPGRTGRALSSP